MNKFIYPHHKASIQNSRLISTGKYNINCHKKRTQQSRQFNCRNINSDEKIALCNSTKYRKEEDDISHVVKLRVKQKQLELSQEINNNQLFWGRMSLMGVATLWGTYAPSLRMIFTFENSPSPTALTAIRGIIGAIPLVLFATMSSNKNQHTKKAQKIEVKQNTKIQQILNLTSPSIWLAGAELGLWNFIATNSQTMGLEFTTATRAGFLIQATQVFTPLLAKLTGEKVGPNVWVACCIALTGTIFLSIDKLAYQSGTISFGVLQGAAFGDLMVLCAALFYSLATVRLSKYAMIMESSKLAAAKSTALAIVACACFVVQTQIGGGGFGGIVGGWGRDGLMWGFIVWSAVGPGALAALLQTKGQSAVPSSQAQVVFCVVPLFSTLWAYLLLGERALGVAGWIGGLLVILAGVVVSIRQIPKPLS